MKTKESHNKANAILGKGRKRKKKKKKGFGQLTKAKWATVTDGGEEKSVAGGEGGKGY